MVAIALNRSVRMLRVNGPECVLVLCHLHGPAAFWVFIDHVITSWPIVKVSNILRHCLQPTKGLRS